MCLQTRTNIDITQQRASASLLMALLHCTWLKILCPGACCHVHVVSSLIHVNQVLLGTSRASNASRKHCPVNSTNVGHCHPTADDRQPCWLRSTTVLSSIHLRRPKGGEVTSDTSLCGRQRLHSDQRGVEEGVSATSTVCNITQKLTPSCAMHVASKYSYSWLHAIWHHMCHDFESTSAGDSQLTWSSVQGSLMNLIWVTRTE